MADPDENVALDVIKDSMNLTDEDLAPEQGELDWGDDDSEPEIQESETPSDENEYDPRSFDSHEGRQSQERQTTSRESRPDPLKQNTLRFDPRADFRQDKRGNLVDSRTGEIIARAGSEARIYQRVHKQATDYIRSAAQNVQSALQQERGKLDRAVEIGMGFERELSELRGTFQQINAYNLPKEHLIEAAGLYHQAQTDPVGVLKNLLTRAALSGIDITQLGMDGNQFDTKTLLDMVRKEIAEGIQPVRQFTDSQLQERQNQQVESQYLRKAETQVQEFFTKNKEAGPYVHIFHGVLQQPQFQNMTLGEIWDKIQLHLIRNGVDPRNPPSRAQRQRMNGTQDGRKPSRSLPNGQGMAPVGSDGRNASGIAHPSKSYGAIIQEILDAGQMR
jgi:hypothetical protein